MKLKLRLAIFLKFIRLLLRKFVVRDGDEARDYFLAETASSILYPKYRFSEAGRIWLDDAYFFNYYTEFVGSDNYHSADRKYFLRSLLAMIDGLEGDLAECGTWTGASAWLMAQAIQGTGRSLHLFDSFEGLSQPKAIDGTYWREGSMRAAEETLVASLNGCDGVNIYRGWIPSRFDEVKDKTFCFTHIDVDLYEPTLASLEFFYDRTSPGGIILFDDYGFHSCPGAKSAIDGFMADKPEAVVHVPTGQALVVKR